MDNADEPNSRTCQYRGFSYRLVALHDTGEWSAKLVQFGPDAGRGGADSIPAFPAAAGATPDEALQAADAVVRRWIDANVAA
jgi:hypothetical protein